MSEPLELEDGRVEAERSRLQFEIVRARRIIENAKARNHGLVAEHFQQQLVALEMQQAELGERAQG